MANRKRGTFSLPEELRTNERLSTKKELAQRKSLPPCPPVPNKVRKSFVTSTVTFDKAKPICYENPVELCPIYNPSLNATYLEQVFSRAGLVGEGSFGRVYRARYREDNQLYAIKRLKSVISFKDRHAEVRNNEKVGVHPNCVRFFMAWEESFEVFMMLEYCDMSLADYAVLNSDIAEDLLWNVLYDICNALQYLHQKNLIHLDVKPGNIMMKNGHFKLTDFGILVDLKLAPRICKSTLSDGDSKYLALEVLEGIYRPSCDIFGLGISLLELAADLELPSHGPLWQQLRHDILPQSFYDRVSLGFNVIIERMLNAEYEARPTADKILKFTTMKAIGKKDKKNPRINYAAPFVNQGEYDLPIQSLPIVINNNNNIVETPRCVPNNDEDMQCGSIRGEPIAGRKALFQNMNEHELLEDADENHTISLSEMNVLFEASMHPNSENPPSDGSSVELAQLLNDSSSGIFQMDFDCENKDHHNDKNGGMSSEESGATLTPIMRCKPGRKLPKTKLQFD